MFNNELPSFFSNEDITNYFSDDISNLFEFKTHETFEGETLKEFIESAGLLEDCLLEYNNLINQKLEYSKQLQKEFADNIGKMRDLNDQICVVKIEKKTFGKKYIKEEYDNQIEESLLDLMEEE